MIAGMICYRRITSWFPKKMKHHYRLCVNPYTADYSTKCVSQLININNYVMVSSLYVKQQPVLLTSHPIIM